MLKNIDDKLDHIKVDQIKVKEEIKQFIPKDVIEKMQTQIKQINTKLKSEDPLLTKTKLDKCASCYQSLNVNLKHDPSDKYTYSPRIRNSHKNKT